MNEIDRGRKQAMSTGRLSRARLGRVGTPWRAVSSTVISQLLQHLRRARRVAGPAISRRIVRLYSEGQTKEDTVGAKGKAFAKQFEAKVEEATTLLEKLSDVDWKKTTAAEKWTVAVTAHHIARSYEPVTHIIKTIAAGQALPHFTPQMLDEMNAHHAKEFAGCTKPETIAPHKKGPPRRPRPCGTSPMRSWRRPAPCSRGCPP
jgi:hypothetical protein